MTRYDVWDGFVTTNGTGHSIFQCSGGTKLLKHQRIWWTNFETNLLGSSYFELPNKDWDGVHTNNAIHIIHIIHHQNLNLGLLDEKSWWLNMFSIQIVGGWCSFTTIFFLRFSSKTGNVLNVVWKPFEWGCLMWFSRRYLKKMSNMWYH